MKIINEHNKKYKEGKYSWYMGVNQFTDWTQEEFASFNSLQIDAKNAPKSDLVYKMKARQVAETLDWRKKVIIDMSIFIFCCVIFPALGTYQIFIML